MNAVRVHVDLLSFSQVVTAGRHRGVDHMMEI
jgi:hypothetical protein